MLTKEAKNVVLKALHESMEMKKRLVERRRQSDNALCLTLKNMPPTEEEKLVIQALLDESEDFQDEYEAQIAELKKSIAEVEAMEVKECE